MTEDTREQEATEYSLHDEAGRIVEERWQRLANRADVTTDPCTYGHFDCSYTEGGPCSNEAVGNEYVRLLEKHGVPFDFVTVTAAPKEGT